MRKKSTTLPTHKLAAMGASLLLLLGVVAFIFINQPGGGVVTTMHTKTKTYECERCGQPNVLNNPVAFKPDPTANHSGNFTPNIVSLSRGLYRPIIETPRLLLREVSMSDLDTLHSSFSSKTTAQSATWQPHTSRQQTRDKINEMLGKYKKNEIAHWAVTRKDTGELIGLGGFTVHTPAHNRARIGWWFDHKHWGNGYATELAHALIEYGMKMLKLNRIDADVRVDNIASRRVLEKAGMNYATTSRDYRILKGEMFSSHIYVILKKNIVAQLAQSKV